MSRSKLAWAVIVLLYNLGLYNLSFPPSTHWVLGLAGALAAVYLAVTNRHLWR